VSAIARAAAVDRTFLYRHPDLLSQVHLAQDRPTAAENGGPQASRASLQADLANAQDQIARQVTRIRQLESKLSQMLGEQAWRDSGLGAPEDIDKLKRRITELEQAVVDLTRQLEERGEELDAARAANREMITQLNAAAPRRSHERTSTAAPAARPEEPGEQRGHPNRERA
jgi:chromosome segregation ATPase